MIGGFEPKAVVFEKARATTKLDKATWFRTVELVFASQAKASPLSIESPSFVSSPDLRRYSSVGLAVITPSPHSLLSLVAFSWIVVFFTLVENLYLVDKI